MKSMHGQIKPIYEKTKQDLSSLAPSFVDRIRKDAKLQLFLLHNTFSFHRLSITITLDFFLRLSFDLIPSLLKGRQKIELTTQQKAQRGMGSDSRCTTDQQQKLKKKLHSFWIYDGLLLYNN